jgi:hypothetical protein
MRVRTDGPSTMHCMAPHLVEVDSTIIDLEEGLALLNLLQHLTPGRLVDDGVALRVDCAQVDLARWVVLAAHVEQHIRGAGMGMPIQ